MALEDGENGRLRDLEGREVGRFWKDVRVLVARVSRRVENTGLEKRSLESKKGRV